MPDAGMFDGLEDFTGGSLWQKFKEDARRITVLSLVRRRGEMVPNDDCYCEIDPR